MTGTILAKPLKGKDVIRQIIRSIASCFVSQSMSSHAVDGTIETIEYDAELESGGTIHGSVTPRPNDRAGYSFSRQAGQKFAMPALRMPPEIAYSARRRRGRILRQKFAVHPSHARHRDLRHSKLTGRVHVA
jgi:hypothetical protein